MVLVALAGCTETVQLTRDPLENMVALDISPGDSTIKLTDLAEPHHTLQFLAMGRFADGTTRDITPLVTWSVDNGLLGEFDEMGRSHGLFTASHAAAGRAKVSIEARGLVAETSLTVIIDATIIDPVFPPPAANLFEPAIPFVSGDPVRSPTLVYPADGTLFPPNIVSTLFQWQRGSSNDAFRIVFDSEVLHLAVETGSDRWQADSDLQRLLAATAITAPIRSEVQATASTIAPPMIYVGNHVTMEFALDAPPKLLYFWSAATNGIMRGGVEESSSGKLYPQSTKCVGCHTVSRDGAQLAMGYDNAPTTDLLTIDAGGGTIIPASTTRPMGWATYSPDGNKLLVANNGVLKLYDAHTGGSLGTVPLGTMRYATHPDWSPDGAYVAVALTTIVAPTNMDVKAASIARIPYNDGTWGTPEILVSGSMTSNNYFPRYSPGGDFLAYVHATGTSQGAVSAELMLVASAGGMAKKLRIASHRLGNTDDVPDLASSMPAWAPKPQTMTGSEHAWLAFVSARPYGTILPTSGRGQIWITALDLTSTGDPSAAAFWLPCQDATVVNNNPVWSETDFVVN